MTYNLLITDLSVNVDAQSTTTYTSTITRTLTLKTTTGVTTTTAVVTSTSRLASSAFNISLLSKRENDVATPGLILSIVIPIVVFITICGIFYYIHFSNNTGFDIEAAGSEETKTVESLSVANSSHDEKCVKPPQIVSFKPSIQAKQCSTPPLAIKYLFQRKSMIPEIVYEPSTPLQTSTKPQLVAKRFSKSLPKLPNTAAIIEKHAYRDYL